MLKPVSIAYQNTDAKILARILDHADPLGFMLMDDFRLESGEDLPSLFRSHLQDIEDKFEGFAGLTASFDRDMKRAQPSRELTAVGT